jgi:hypothetical protein
MKVETIEMEDEVTYLFSHGDGIREFCRGKWETLILAALVENPLLLSQVWWKWRNPNFISVFYNFTGPEQNGSIIFGPKEKIYLSWEI